MTTRVISIQCECGRTIAQDRAVSRPECECGRIYAVTVTLLQSPE